MKKGHNMKKRLLLALVVLAMMVSMSVSAAGKISVTQENFIVTTAYNLYGYVYARIDNVGDKPIKVNAGILEIFDGEGNAITSSDYLVEYAEYLQPDEYTYAYLYTDIENVEASEIDDYMLTITGKSDTSYVSQRLPVTTEYKEDVNERYSSYDYMYATVTNNSENPIFGVDVVLALLDADGNILYMDNASMYEEKAIMPGSSIMIQKRVDSSFIEAYEKEGLVPVSVDAIAYVNVSQE